MTTITRTCYLHRKIGTDHEPVFGQDMSKMGYVLLGVQEVTFETDDATFNEKALAVYREKREEITAEYTRKLAVIDRQIAELQALPAPEASE